MYGEFLRDDALSPEPLPPARTRWAEEPGNGPGTSGSLLGPVRSGPVGSVAPAPITPSFEDAGVEPEADQSADWATDGSPSNWDEIEPEAVPVHELVMEDGSDAGIDLVFESDEIEILVEPDAADLDLTEAIPAGAGQIASSPIERESRPQDDRPTPLSAWDLAAHSGDSEERARRAREEWDNLEQALVQSLGSTPAVSSAQAERAGPDGFPTELEELARRLEQFAAALRADGTRAMEMAQSRGDPIDVVLAALAAGYVSGRRE
jgi:hypothetical protein